MKKLTFCRTSCGKLRARFALPPCMMSAVVAVFLFLAILAFCSSLTLPTFVIPGTGTCALLLSAALLANYPFLTASAFGPSFTIVAFWAWAFKFEARSPKAPLLKYLLYALRGSGGI